MLAWLTRRFPTLVLACVLLASAGSAFGDEPAADEPSPPPRFTLEAFLQVPTLGSPVVSPDGTRVAYLHRKRSLEQDEQLVSLWVAPVETGPPRRITYSDAPPRSIAWRPGGGVSYRLAEDGEPAQVWLNPLDGSEPRPVTDMEQGVLDYRWSPDGRLLAVLARQPEEDGDAETEAADWTVYDRLEQPERYPQLWIVEAGADGPAEASPRQLTSPPLYGHHVAFSPDGRTIALTYNPRFSSLVDEEQRIDLIDVETGERTTITPETRHASLASFSPDGGKVAYFVDRREEMRAYLNLKDLAVYDRGSGETRVLTAETEMTLGGSGSTPRHAPLWTHDGRRLVVAGARGTSLDLYVVSMDGGGLEPLTRLEGNVGGFDLASGTLAYLESRLHRPGSLRAGPLDDPAAARMIDSTDDAVAEYGLQAPTKLALPGHEDTTVEGFLFLPHGAAKEPPHPAVIETHGGPYYRYGDAWSARYPWHVLAEHGFAVFIANPRGGTGHGEEFLRGNYRGFGTDDYRDLMAAVDALVERGIVDGERLGFTGYSYGGLMTNTVVSRTDRFAAAVSIAGLFNFVSAMGQNNPQLLIDAYRRPWDDDLARLWEHSPAARAASISTPILIMHGEADKAVDPRQSIEMFTYLQLNGVPSRLVLYPEEGHGIDRPSHMLDYQRREVEWFRHYLLGEPEAEGAAPPAPVETTPAPGS